MQMMQALRRRWLDAVWIILLCALIFALFHYWAVDRQSGLRLIYPLQARLAKLQSQCSERAPSWMRELLDHVVDEQFSLSNQIAYLSPNGTLHHCESGWEGSMLGSAPVSATTRFRYASITKLLTADAVLAQINAGHLSLDTHLLDVVPLATPVADPWLFNITIEQLLRHRAGFDRLKSVDPMTRHIVKPWCPGDLEQLARLRLDFSPGERFSYSNLGYCLLGVVLEKVSGKPYRGLMEKEYGLSGRGLRFVDGPYQSDEVTYDFRNSQFYVQNYYRYFDFPALSSSAGMSGNAVSLAELLREMLEHRPLNLISANLDGGCNSTNLFKCFGFAVSPFRGRDGTLVLYVQMGLLFGATSMAAIDSEGGVVIWLGNGMSQHPYVSATTFVERVWALLSTYYQK